MVYRDKMVVLRQPRDEFLKRSVIMGIAHDALHVAAEFRRCCRELHRISSNDDQRSALRPSLAGNR